MPYRWSTIEVNCRCVRGNKGRLGNELEKLSKEYVLQECNYGQVAVGDCRVGGGMSKGDVDVYMRGMRDGGGLEGGGKFWYPVGEPYASGVSILVLCTFLLSSLFFFYLLRLFSRGLHLCCRGTAPLLVEFCQ